MFVSHLGYYVESHCTELHATVSEVQRRSMDCQLCHCHFLAADVDHQWTGHHQPDQATITFQLLFSFHILIQYSKHSSSKVIYLS